MSSISTQQSNVLQQVGAVQPMSPPPEDVKHAGHGGGVGTSAVQGGDTGSPPPTPVANVDGEKMGGQSGQPSGADMQSIFQGLLDAADTAANTAVATLTAAAGYGTASAIFAWTALLIQKAAPIMGRPLALLLWADA